MTRSRSNSDAASQAASSDVQSLPGVATADPELGDLAPILDVKVRTGLISEDEYQAIVHVVRRASLVGDADDAPIGSRSRADSRGFEEVVLSTDVS